MSICMNPHCRTPYCPGCSAPAVSPDPNANWENDAIQFPRLICEIADTVLRPEDYAEIATSMDVTNEELEELFDRALAAWDGIKARTPSR